MYQLDGAWYQKLHTRPLLYTMWFVTPQWLLVRHFPMAPLNHRCQAHTTMHAVCLRKAREQGTMEPITQIPLYILYTITPVPCFWGAVSSFVKTLALQIIFTYSFKSYSQNDKVLVFRLLHISQVKWSKIYFHAIGFCPFWFNHQSSKINSMSISYNTQ